MTYYWDTAIALAKLMGWALVVFAFLARRVGRSTSVWGDVMRQVFVLIVIVHGLLLLRIFDTGSLIVSYVALYIGRRYYSTPEGIRGFFARASLFLHDVIYEILEGTFTLRDLPRRARDAGVGLLKGARSLGLEAWQGIALAVLLGAVLIPRVIVLGFFPFPRAAREYEHVVALKHMASNGFAAELYPRGAHALALTLRSTSLVDEMMTWTVLGPVLLVLQGLVLFALVHAAKRRFAEAIIASALLLLTLGHPEGRELLGAMEVHPWHFAALLLPICVHISARILQDPEVESSALATSSGALLFVHPLTWGLFVGSLGLQLGVQRIVARRKSALLPILRWVISGGVFALGLTVGVALSRGATIDIKGWLQELFVTYGSTASSPDVLLGLPLFVLGSASALLLLLAPGGASPDEQERRAFIAASFLGLSFVGAFARFGFSVGIPLDAFFLLTAPVGALVFGEALALGRESLEAAIERFGRQSRWVRPALDRGAVVVVALLCITALPTLGWSTPPTLSERETIAAYIKLNDEYESRTWTIVGPHELDYHVMGNGWYMRPEDFLQRYPDPNLYIWDPRKPERAIPTTHTFIFALRNRKDRDAPDKQLHEWCRDYMLSNEDMRFWLVEPNLVVYHLERTKEHERLMLDTIWAEENPGK